MNQHKKLKVCTVQFIKLSNFNEYRQFLTRGSLDKETTILNFHPYLIIANIQQFDKTIPTLLSFGYKSLCKIMHVHTLMQQTVLESIQIQTSSSSDSSSCSIAAAFASGMTGAGCGALNFSAA